MLSFQTWRNLISVSLLVTILSLDAGCSTAKGTGSLAGGGIGAGIGAIAGGTQGAIIGAAIGTGVGYIIGDQVDEQKAKDIEAGKVTADVAPLGGTRWRVVSITTSEKTKPYISRVVEFRPDSHVITTGTLSDGKVEVFDESYRVVGDTLIINKPGYMINATYKMPSNQLVVQDAKFSATLERLP